jgi:hypothetical protein
MTLSLARASPTSEMAAATRTFPLPRGQLSHSLGSYYANYLMTASLDQTGTGGNTPQVGLCNNALDGRYLHVIGMNCWYSVSNADVLVQAVNIIPGSSTVVQPTPVNPLMAPSAGEVIGLTAGADVGTLSVWTFCGNGFRDTWYGDDPLYILPPGWSLYGLPSAPDGTLSMSFRWLALKP